MDPDTTTMDYDTWTGRNAYDANGDKIGSIKDIYFDDVTGRPEWIEVKAGLFKGTRLAPLTGARIDTDPGDAEDRLRLAFDEDRVKDAPDMDTGDDHLSSEQERELYSYYGFNWDDRNDTDFGYGPGWLGQATIRADARPRPTRRRPRPASDSDPATSR
jgi:sporulation protein YlmC with PRC-barrel domain